MATPDRLIVALLAAGRSRRFGDADKLSARLAGKPLLHWAAEAGRAVNAAQHIIVTGPDFAGCDLPSGYLHLVNASTEEGLASSLRIAAAHARETGACSLLILLGDMPRVTTAHLQSLLALHTDRAIFSRAPSGSPQPPALFSAALFPALEALAGDAGARSLASDALFVEADADLLIDIDTPDDLARCGQLLVRSACPDQI